MSDALQTSTAESEVITVDAEPTPIITRGLPMDKLTSKITLFSGVVPLTMTIEAMVEKVEDVNMNISWYVTLHLTGFGTTQRIFMSNTVPITLGVVTPVTFPPMSYTVGASEYGLQTIGTAVGVSGVTAMVQLNPVPGGTPKLQILNTTIDAQWVIGAIDILITDPPIIMEIQS